MVAEFAAAIRDGRPALTDGRAGLRVLTVLEAVSASLEVVGAGTGAAPMPHPGPRPGVSDPTLEAVR